MSEVAGEAGKDLHPSTLLYRRKLHTIATHIEHTYDHNIISISRPAQSDKSDTSLECKSVLLFKLDLFAADPGCSVNSFAIFRQPSATMLLSYPSLQRSKSDQHLHDTSHRGNNAKNQGHGKNYNRGPECGPLKSVSSVEPPVLHLSGL
jgi:hypothetical protein